MTHHNEAHRDWRIEPCSFNSDWHSVGYTYEGNQGTHQGEFVPVHHWSGKTEAETMRDALIMGKSREEARQAAIDA